MFTNNYYVLFKSCVGGVAITQGATATDGTKQDVAISNNQGALFFPMNITTTSSSYVSRSKTSSGWAFGTGQTPPTLDDYWLSGTQITTLEIRSVIAEYTDKACEVKKTYTLQNTGTETVTIREMAAIASGYKSYNSTFPTMINRIVLDTPLTLAPDEQGVITYTFTLPVTT